MVLKGEQWDQCGCGVGFPLKSERGKTNVNVLESYMNLEGSPPLNLECRPLFMSQGGGRRSLPALQVSLEALRLLDPECQAPLGTQESLLGQAARHLNNMLGRCAMKLPSRMQHPLVLGFCVLAGACWAQL